MNHVDLRDRPVRAPLTPGTIAAQGMLWPAATAATQTEIVMIRRLRDGPELGSGLAGQRAIRLFASAESHSPVDRAARTAGIGQRTLVRISDGPDPARDPAAPAGAIAADRAAGFLPAAWIRVHVGPFDCTSADVAMIAQVVADHS